MHVATGLLDVLWSGASTYDVADLRPAHYSMNIASHHFDTMLSIIKEVFIYHIPRCQCCCQILTVELELSKADVREVLKAMQPVRGDIINGCECLCVLHLFPLSLLQP